MPCCCVLECSNRSEIKNKETDGITFHLFPRNPKRLCKWIAALKREDWKPSYTMVICSKHFEESCFYKTKNGLTRLLNNAVPTLDIPHIPKTSEEIVWVTNSENMPIEVSLAYPVLDPPKIDNKDPPIVKTLGSHIRRLQYICKRQRKLIRNLRLILKEQDTKLLRFNTFHM